MAGPGAGKTELLAQRACYLLQTGTLTGSRRILALSFKRSAAQELYDRVAARCGPELAQRLESYTFAAWAKGLVDRFRLAIPAAYRPTADYLINTKLDQPDSYPDLRDWLLRASPPTLVKPEWSSRLERRAVAACAAPAAALSALVCHD